MHYNTLLAVLVFSLGCFGCSDGDGKKQEIEVSDGIDGQDGQPGARGEPGPQGPRGEQGAPGSRGPAGPSGPSGGGDRGPQGETGEPGQDGRDGQDGAPGRDGAPCQYEEGDEGYTLTCPGQDPVYVPYGRDGRDGGDGRDGSGMDPTDRWRCTGWWRSDGWHWDLELVVVKYSTGHYWLRMAQTGSSVSREGLMWDEPVEALTELFAGLWQESGERVRWRHRSSGTIWNSDCTREDI